MERIEELENHSGYRTGYTPHPTSNIRFLLYAFFSTLLLLLSVNVGLCDIPDTWTLKVDISSDGGGSVKINGVDGLEVSVQSDQTVNQRKKTIIATPNIGYEFVCWKVGNDSISNASTYTVTISGTVTYTAHFKPKSYTFTLHANGGSGSPATLTLKYTENFSSLPVPSRVGYRFDGWYTNSDFNGNPLTLQSEVKNYTNVRDLYAKWTCVVSAGTVSITSNPAIASMPPTVCPTDTVTLTASISGQTTGTGISVAYAWSPSEDLDVSSGAIVNASPSQEKTYTVTTTVSADPSCQASTSTQVTVYVNAPSVTLSNAAAEPNPVCAGQSVALNTSVSGTFVGNVTYAWTGPEGYTAAEKNPTVSSMSSSKAGKYTVTATATNTVNGVTCTASSQKFVMVTVNTPSISLAEPAQSPDTLCEGEDLTLSVTPNGTSSGTVTYAWTGPEGYTAAVKNPTVDSMSSSKAGTYTVTATASFGGTCSASDTKSISVTVNRKPEMNDIEQPAQITMGGSFDLPDSSRFVTYQGPSYEGQGWKYCETADGSYQPFINSNVSVEMNGKYLRYYAVNSCGETHTNAVVMRVSAVPTIADSTITAPGGLCEGQPLGIDPPVVDGHGGDYSTEWQWCSTSSGTFAAMDADRVPYNGGSYYVRFRAYNVSGEALSIAVQVSVQQSPYITLTNADQTVCQGVVITDITVSSNGTDVNVTGLTSGLSWDNVSKTISGTANSTCTYTVSASSSNGCASTSSGTITVNSKPDIVVHTPVSAICEGGSFDLQLDSREDNGSEITVERWEIGTSPTSLFVEFQNTAVQYASNGNYIRYYAENACGVTTTVPVQVSVNKTPEPPTVAGDTLCGAGQATLTANPGSDNTCIWYNDAGTELQRDTSIYTTGTLDAGSEYIYRVSAYNTATGCESQSRTLVKAIVSGMPEVTGAVHTDMSCHDVNDGDVTVTATPGSLASTLTYTIDDGNSWQTGNVFDSLPAGSYTVRVKNNFGCEAASSAVTVVNPAQLTVSMNDIVSQMCAGGSVTLQATVQNNQGNVTYNWTANGGSIGATNPFTAYPTATAEYNVSVSDAKGCTATGASPKTVTVLGAFSAGAINGGGTSIESGGAVNEITSAAAATGGSSTPSYRWLHNGGVIDGATEATYTPAAYTGQAGSHVFTRQAQSESCNSGWVNSAGSYTVIVNDAASPKYNIQLNENLVVTKIECWGGGGGGSDRSLGGGGGGGGGYAGITPKDGANYFPTSVIPANALLQVVSGSGGEVSGDGENSYVSVGSGTTLVRASGGKGGNSDNRNGGQGGQGGSSDVVGSVSFSEKNGGDGGDGSLASQYGGGGGGAAGNGGNGGDGGDGSRSRGGQGGSKGTGDGNNKAGGGGYAGGVPASDGVGGGGGGNGNDGNAKSGARGIAVVYLAAKPQVSTTVPGKICEGESLNIAEYITWGGPTDNPLSTGSREWQLSDSATGPFSAWPSFDIANVTSEWNDHYLRLHVHTDYGDAYSTPVQLQVQAKVTPVFEGLTAEYCPDGENLVLPVRAGNKDGIHEDFIPGTWKENSTAVTSIGKTNSGQANIVHNLTFTPSTGYCAVSASATVTVCGVPSVAGLSEAAVCVTESYNPAIPAVTNPEDAAVSAYSDYGWLYRASTRSGSYEEKTLPSTLPYNDQGYYFTYFVQNRCGIYTSDTIHVSVNNVPEAGTLSSIPAICENGSLLLTVPDDFNPYASAGAYTAEWQMSTDESQTGWEHLAEGTATSTGPVSSDKNGRYVRYYVTNGCGRDSSTAQRITVNKLPSITIGANPGSEICEGSSTVLSVRENYDYYQWSTGSAEKEITVSPDYTAKYIVQVRDGNSCIKKDSVTVVVKDTATLAVAGGSLLQTICLGDEIDPLTFTSNAGVEFSNLPSGMTFDPDSGVLSGIPTETKTYTVTTSNLNNCGVRSKSGTVTVNPKPSAPTLTDVTREPDTFIVCGVNGITLTADPGTGNTCRWYGADGTVKYEGNSYTVSSLSPGIYDYNVSAVNNGTNCESGGRTHAVAVVGSNPAISKVEKTDMSCHDVQDGKIVVTAAYQAPATTLYYTRNTVYGTDGVFEGLEAGKYKIKVKDNFGCIAEWTDSITIVNPDQLTVSLTAAPASVCAGESVMLTAAAEHAQGDVDYTWKNDATVLGITAINTYTDYPTAAANSYNVSVSDSHGCTATASTSDVAVQDTVKLVVTGVMEQTFCLGNPMTEVTVAGSNATVNVTGLPNGVAYTGGKISGSPAAAGSSTITITANSNNGCNSYDKTETLTITVKDTVTLTVTGDISQTVCQNVPVTPVKFASNGTMQASGLPAGIAFDSASGILSGTPAETKTYTITTDDYNGCGTKSMSGTITMNALPVVTVSPVAVTIGRWPSSDERGATQTTLTASGASTYSWYKVSDNVGTGSTYTTPVTLTDGEHSYQVTGTDANGCSNTAASTVTVITPEVTLNDITASRTALCQTESSTLTVSTSSYTGTVPVSYSWSPATGLNTTEGNEVTAAPTVTATYTVTATAVAGTGSNTTSATAAKSVTVYVNPAVTMNNPSVMAQTICHNGKISPVSFSSSLDASKMTYTWTNDNGNIGGLSASGTGDLTDLTLTNTTSQAQTATITVTPHYTDHGLTCDGEPKTFTVTVNPEVKMNEPEVSATTICNAGTINAAFSTSLTGGTVTYTWTRDNTEKVTGENAGSAISDLLLTNTESSNQETKFTVIPSYTNDGVTCAAAVGKEFTVTVIPQVVMNTPSDQRICHGTQISQVDFSTTNTGGTMTYSWTRTNTDNVTGLAGTATDVTSLPATALSNTSAAEQTTTFTVTPTYTLNGLSCTGTPVTFKVTVNPQVKMNAVTDQYLCHNTSSEAITLTSPITGDAMSYSWSRDNTTNITGLANSGSTAVIAAATALNATATVQTATYTVKPTYTSAGVSCTMAGDSTFSITVCPNVSLAQVDPQFVSHDSIREIQLQSGNSTDGSISYTWTRTPADGVSGSETGSGSSLSDKMSVQLTNTGNEPKTVTFTVTPTYHNEGTACQGAPMSFDMTVNPKITMKITAPANPDQIICSGTEMAACAFGTDLVIDANKTIAYNWTRTSVSGVSGLEGPSSGDISATAMSNSNAEPKTVTFTVTPRYTANGITADGEPKTFTVTVNPEVRMNAVADQDVCDGSALTVDFGTALTGGTTSYSWTRDNADIGTLPMSGSGNVSSNVTNSTNVAQTAVFTVVPTYANVVTCTATADNYQEFNVTVNKVPTTPAIAVTEGDTVFCHGGSVTLVASCERSADAGPFQWFIDGNPVDPVNNSTLKVEEPAAGIRNISVVQESSHGCGTGEPASRAIYVHDITISGITADPDAVCGEGDVTLTAAVNSSVPGAASVVWTIANGAVVGNQPQIRIHLAEQTAYTVTAGIPNVGCTVTSTHTVNVYAPFNPGSIESGTRTVAAGGNIGQISSQNPASGGGGSYTYQWRRNGTVLNNSNSETYSPAAIGTAGTYVFTRWAKDGNCTNDWVQSAGSYTVMVTGTSTGGYTITLDANTVVTKIEAWGGGGGGGSGTGSGGGGGGGYARIEPASGSAYITSIPSSSTLYVFNGSGGVINADGTSSDGTSSYVKDNESGTLYLEAYAGRKGEGSGNDRQGGQGGQGGTTSLPSGACTSHYNYGGNGGKGYSGLLSNRGGGGGGAAGRNGNGSGGSDAGSGGEGNGGSGGSGQLADNEIPGVTGITGNGGKGGSTNADSRPSVVGSIYGGGGGGGGGDNNKSKSGAQGIALVYLATAPSATITQPNAICENTSLAITPSVSWGDGNQQSSEWQFAALSDFSSVAATATDINAYQVASSFNGYYVRLAVTTEYGTRYSNAVQITVKPKQHPVFDLEKEYCPSGRDIALPAFANNSDGMHDGLIIGAWMNTSTSQPVSSLPGDNTAADDLNYPVKFTPGTGYCAYDTVFTVTVWAKPRVTLSNDVQTVCQGTAVTPVTINPAHADDASAWHFDDGGSGLVKDGLTISGTMMTAGTFNYSVTAGSEHGCTHTATVSGTVTVTPYNTIALTSPTETANQTVCNHNPITDIKYATTGATGADFTDLPAGVTGQWNDNEVTISGTPTVGGTFNYTVTMTGGCVLGTNTATGTITVNDPQITLQALRDTIVCSGNSVEMKAVVEAHQSDQITYAWYKNSGTEAYKTVSSFTEAYTDTAIYRLVATAWKTENGLQCSVSDMAEATVIVTDPAVNGLTVVANPSAMCCEDSSVLTASCTYVGSAVSYSWSGEGLNKTSGAEVKAGKLGTGGSTTVYTVTATAVSGSCTVTATSTGTVIVNPQVVMNTPSSVTICHNAGVNIPFSNSGTNLVESDMRYTWTSTNDNVGGLTPGTVTSAGIVASALTNATSEPQTTEIEVTPTYHHNDITCTGTPVTFTITVNPEVKMEIPVVQPAAMTICHGGSIDAAFSTSLTGGTTTYTWTRDNDDVVSGTASGTGNIENLVLTNTNLTYKQTTFTVTPVFEGCTASESGQRKFTVSVNPQVVMDTPSDITICHNDNLNVTFTTGLTGGETTCTWTRDNDNVGGTASGDTHISGLKLTNTTDQAQVTTFTVTPSFKHNDVSCTGTPVTFKVTVNPQVKMNAVTDQYLCHNTSSEAITLTSPITGGAMSYSWSRDNTTNITGLANSGSTAEIAAATALNATATVQTATYTVKPTYTNAGVSCTMAGDSTFSITVYPNVSLAQVDPQFVSHDSIREIQLQSGNSTDGSISYTWTRTPADGVSGPETGSGSSLSDKMSVQLTNTGNEPKTVTFTVTPTYHNEGTDCQGAPMSFDMTVNPKITMKITAPANPDQIICSGTEMAACAFGTDLVIDANKTIAYNWTRTAETGVSGSVPESGTGNIAAAAMSNSNNEQKTLTFTVTPRYTANGITADGEPETFTLKVNPQVKMNTVAHQDVCDGSALTVDFGTALTGGTTSYSWTRDNNNIGTLPMSGSGNISSDVTNSANVAQTAAFAVTSVYTNGIQCRMEGDSSFTVTVNKNPVTPTLSGTADLVCYPTSVTYTAESSTPDAGAFRWTVNGTEVEGNTSGTYIFNAPSVGNYTIAVVQVSSHGCGVSEAASKTVEVKALDPGKIVAGQMESYLCGSFSISNVASAECTSEEDITYKWTCNGTDIENSNMSSISQVQYPLEIAGTYVFKRWAKTICPACTESTWEEAEGSYTVTVKHTSPGSVAGSASNIYPCQDFSITNTAAAECLAGQTPVYQWSYTKNGSAAVLIDVPENTMSITQVDLPLEVPGVYVITRSAKTTCTEEEWQTTSVTITVGTVGVEPGDITPRSGARTVCANTDYSIGNVADAYSLVDGQELYYRWDCEKIINGVSTKYKADVFNNIHTADLIVNGSSHADCLIDTTGLFIIRRYAWAGCSEAGIASAASEYRIAVIAPEQAIPGAMVSNYYEVCTGGKVTLTEDRSLATIVLPEYDNPLQNDTLEPYTVKFQSSYDSITPNDPPYSTNVIPLELLSYGPEDLYLRTQFQYSLVGGCYAYSEYSKVVIQNDPDYSDDYFVSPDPYSGELVCPNGEVIITAPTFESTITGEDLPYHYTWMLMREDGSYDTVASEAYYSYEENGRIVHITNFVRAGYLNYDVIAENDLGCNASYYERYYYSPIDVNVNPTGPVVLTETLDRHYCPDEAAIVDFSSTIAESMGEVYWYADSLTAERLETTPEVSRDTEQIFRFFVSQNDGSCESARIPDSVIIRYTSHIAYTSGTFDQALPQKTLFTESPIEPITFEYSNYYADGTAVPVATGLPQGVSGVANNGVFTVSGEPVEPGVFNYTVRMEGGECPQPTEFNGTLTVYPAYDTTVYFSSCNGSTYTVSDSHNNVYTVNRVGTYHFGCGTANPLKTVHGADSAVTVVFTEHTWNQFGFEENSTLIAGWSSFNSVNSPIAADCDGSVSGSQIIYSTSDWKCTFSTDTSSLSNPSAACNMGGNSLSIPNKEPWTTNPTNGHSIIIKTSSEGFGNLSFHADFRTDKADERYSISNSLNQVTLEYSDDGTSWASMAQTQYLPVESNSAIRSAVDLDNLPKGMNDKSTLYIRLTFSGAAVAALDFLVDRNLLIDNICISGKKGINEVSLDRTEDTVCRNEYITLYAPEPYVDCTLNPCDTVAVTYFWTKTMDGRTDTLSEHGNVLLDQVTSSATYKVSVGSGSCTSAAQCEVTMNEPIDSSGVIIRHQTECANNISSFVFVDEVSGDTVQGARILSPAVEDMQTPGEYDCRLSIPIDPSIACDSIITLKLTVLKSYDTTIVASICLGDSYTDFGFDITPTETGVSYYRNVGECTSGCDSIVNLTLETRSVEKTLTSVEDELLAAWPFDIGYERIVPSCGVKSASAVLSLGASNGYSASMVDGHAVSESLCYYNEISKAIQLANGFCATLGAAWQSYDGTYLEMMVLPREYDNLQLTFDYVKSIDASYSSYTAVDNAFNKLTCYYRFGKNSSYPSTGIELNLSGGNTWTQAQLDLSSAETIDKDTMFLKFVFSGGDKGTGRTSSVGFRTRYQYYPAYFTIDNFVLKGDKPAQYFLSSSDVEGETEFCEGGTATFVAQTDPDMYVSTDDTFYFKYFDFYLTNDEDETYREPFVTNKMTITPPYPANYSIVAYDRVVGCDSVVGKYRIQLNKTAHIAEDSLDHTLKAPLVCSGAHFSFIPQDGVHGEVPPTTRYSWVTPTATNIVVEGEYEHIKEESLNAVIRNTDTVNYQSAPVTFEVTPWVGECEGQKFYVEVEVVPSVSMSFINPVSSACPGEDPIEYSVNIENAMSVGGQKVRWEFNGDTTVYDYNPLSNHSIALPYICDTSYIVKTTYYDDAECSVTASVTVSAVDDEAPSLSGTWPSDITGQNNCFSGADRSVFISDEDVAALFTDNCTGAVTATHEDTDNPTDNCGWTITRTYTVKDACGNVYYTDGTSTLPVQKLSGSDRTRPTYTRPGDTVLYVSCAAVNSSDTTVTALGEPTGVSDNCSETTDIQVTHRDSIVAVCGHAEKIFRIWRVVDACGNVSVSDSIQFINVIDTVKLTATADTTQTLCNGKPLATIAFGGNGTLSVAPASLLGLTFNAGERTISGTPTETGTVNFAVTATNGCPAYDKTVTGVITHLEQLVLTVIVDSTECESNNGTVMASAKGGLMPYRFKIDGDGETTTGLFNDLSEGAHTVTMTDSLACPYDESAGIIKVEALDVQDIKGVTRYGQLTDYDADGNMIDLFGNLDTLPHLTQYGAVISHDRTMTDLTATSDSGSHAMVVSVNVAKVANAHTLEFQYSADGTNFFPYGSKKIEVANSTTYSHTFPNLVAGTYYVRAILRTCREETVSEMVTVVVQ